MAQTFDTKNVRDLELFYKPGCPWCNKVRTYMQDHNVDDVKEIDIISDSEGRDRLAEIGGKVQVPCLFINGKPLYESSDIIAFFEKLDADKLANRA